MTTLRAMVYGACLAALVVLAGCADDSDSATTTTAAAAPTTVTTTTTASSTTEAPTTTTAAPTTDTTALKQSEDLQVADFEIDDATGALLTIGDLPPGWENLSPASQLVDADLGQLLLACGEELEAELGVVDYGSLITHGRIADQILFNHSVRIQDRDSAAELLARTDEAAANCNETWIQALPEEHEFSIAPPPAVEPRGDGTSVYATTSVALDPNVPSLSGAIVQIRCGPVISRLAISSFSGTPVPEALIDDLAELAYDKLARVIEGAGGRCGIAVAPTANNSDG